MVLILHVACRGTEYVVAAGYSYLNKERANIRLLRPLIPIVCLSLERGLSYRSLGSRLLASYVHHSYRRSFS